MRETKIIYKCDICNAEVVEEKHLEKVIMPVKTLDCEGRSVFDSFDKVDMCRECLKKYRESVYRNFGVVTVGYGNEIKFNTQWVG